MVPTPVTALLSALLLGAALAEPEHCSAADMPRVSLGDGNMLPAVGLGLYYTPPGAVAQDIVREALRLGYRHLDTAGFYENEADVGRAVRESGIPREQIHITSKVWPEAEGRWVEDGFAAVLDAVNASVAALGTRADLYLIHWPVNPEQRIEYWLATRGGAAARTRAEHRGEQLWRRPPAAADRFAAHERGAGRQRGPSPAGDRRGRRLTERGAARPRRLSCTPFCERTRSRPSARRVASA